MSQAAITSASHTIRAALETLNTPAEGGSDVPYKRVLLLAADQLKTETAKVGVMYSTGVGTPAMEELSSLLDSLQQHVITFCVACHGYTSGAGPTLMKDIQKAATAVVNPCLAVLKAMDNNNAADIKHQIGLVWQGCDAVRKMAVDNKGAVFKQLAGVYQVVKDTMREMKDLQDDQDGDDAEDDAAGDDITRAADTTTNGVSHAHDDDDDDHEAASPSGRPLSQQTPHGAAQPSSATAGENGQSQPSQSHGQSGQQLAGIVDLDYEAGPLSIEEQQVLAGCTQLADVAAATLKCFSKALLEGPGLSGGDRDLLDSWESCLFHSKHLQRSIEDIGAAMYPPQDPDEVQDAADALAETLELMMDECPVADAIGSQLQQLQDKIQTARQQLLDSLPAPAHGSD
eukprot:jgi/Chrzof1/8842/Cz03g26080.t1